MILSVAAKVPPNLSFTGNEYNLTIYVYQMIIDQTTRDNSVRSLLSKMNEVYSFLMKEDLRDIESMKTVVERICHQTLECSYFIREYSQNKNFRKLS
jgi:hypothetical protein